MMLEERITFRLPTYRIGELIMMSRSLHGLESGEAELADWAREPTSQGGIWSMEHAKRKVKES